MNRKENLPPESKIERFTAVEIPIYHPGMEPIEKATEEGEATGKIEFNRNAIHDEIRGLATGYEYALRGIAEETEAKRKVENPQREKRSLNSLFRRRAELSSGQHEDTGFTESPKYQFTVGYHREKKRDGGKIVPDYYILDLTPDGEEKTIDSSLKVDLVDGKISTLEFTGDIRMGEWEEKEGLSFAFQEHFASKEDYARQREEESKRIQVLEMQAPLISSLKREITGRDSSGKEFTYTNNILGSIALTLELHDVEGPLDSPILQVNEISRLGYSGQYKYDLAEQAFKLQKDTLLERGERMDAFRLRRQPFAESLEVTPTDIMQEMLDLIPAKKR